MATLRACSGCGSFIKRGESSCPFCGVATPSAGLGLTAAAVLMGLTMAGCEKQGTSPPTVEPEYGVPVSDTAAPDDGGVAPDDGGALDGGEPGADEGGAEPPVAEPEYGVADPG